MKNIKKYIGILAFIIISSTLMAQAPPPPNNDNTTSGGTTPVGGGAPIADGFILLISGALIYVLTVKKTNFIVL